MSTVELHGQAVRQAWVQKGRARERDSSATGVKVVELVSIAVLITAAALWPVVAPFDLVTRFVVALGAVVMIPQAFHARSYAVAASAIPFITSLAWRGAKAAH